MDIYNGSEEKFGDEYEYLLTMILDELTDIRKEVKMFAEKKTTPIRFLS